MSFADLKRSSKSNFEKLTKALESTQSRGNNNSDDDSKFWKLTVDKAGNGFAVIRFLDSPEGEDCPFVKIYDHGFQGPTGKWYIQKSLSTIGQADPLFEYNGKLYQSGNESDKEQAKKQKRRLSFYSNIYVIKDPNNPENEGKVFLYKYGKNIFDMINDKMNPSQEYEEIAAVNPFDLWEGANFKLRARMKDGYRSYDKSEFEDVSPIKESDDEKEAIWSQSHKLKDLISPDKFKTYDELHKLLYSVLGENDGKEDLPYDEPKKEKVAESKKIAEKTYKDSDASIPATNSIFDEDEDDDLAFFRNLTNSDED